MEEAAETGKTFAFGEVADGGGEFCVREIVAGGVAHLDEIFVVVFAGVFQTASLADGFFDEGIIAEKFFDKFGGFCL